MKAQDAIVEHLQAADRLTDLETQVRRSDTVPTEQKSNTAIAANQAVRHVSRQTDLIVNFQISMASVPNSSERQFFIRDNSAHLLHGLLLQWTTIDLSSTEQEELDLFDNVASDGPSNALIPEGGSTLADNINRSDMDHLYSVPKRYGRSRNRYAETQTKGKARMTSHSPAQHETTISSQTRSHSSPRRSQSVKYYDWGSGTKKSRSNSRQRPSGMETGKADTRRVPRSTPYIKHYEQSPAGGRKVFNVPTGYDSSSESDTGGVRIVESRPRERSISPIRRRLEPTLKATKRKDSNQNQHYERETATNRLEIEVEIDSSGDHRSGFYCLVHNRKRPGRKRDHKRNTWGTAVIMRSTPRSTINNTSDYLSDSDDFSVADTIREPVLYRYNDSWTDPVTSTLWLSSST